MLCACALPQQQPQPSDGGEAEAKAVTAFFQPALQVLVNAGAGPHDDAQHPFSWWILMAAEVPSVAAPADDATTAEAVAAEAPAVTSPTSLWAKFKSWYGAGSN